MKQHELKTDSEVFDATQDGKKNFEIRFNDRDYQIGDMLILQETEHTGLEMKNGSPLIYTGYSIKAQVTYILRGPIYGLATGWVIMAHQPV
jgi:ASC-1-like (ASCH) protein